MFYSCGVKAEKGVALVLRNDVKRLTKVDKFILGYNIGYSTFEVSYYGVYFMSEVCGKTKQEGLLLFTP